MAIDLRADYDDGCFDKDEQGWCSRRVQVTSEGERVTIRRSGDDNGLRAYDETSVGTIGPAWPELGLVQIVGERGPLAYFDTRSGRLRTPREQVPHWFTAPPRCHEPGELKVALAMIAEVAAALDMRPGPPPAQVEMPALTPSTTAAGARESQQTLPGAPGYRWVFMRREYPDGDPLGPQFDVRVEGAGGWVSLFVGERRRAMLLFFGPLERYHLATAARDRALAAWCA